MSAIAISFEDWLASVEGVYAPSIDALADLLEACDGAGVDTEAGWQVIEAMNAAVERGDAAEVDRLFDLVIAYAIQGGKVLAGETRT